MVTFSVVPLMEHTIKQIFRVSRACSPVTDLNARNKRLTAKLLTQAIGIINFERLFSNVTADTMDLNSMSD